MKKLKSAILSLFESRTTLPPKEIVALLEEQFAFQDIATALWTLIDEGKIDYNGDKTLRRSDVSSIHSEAGTRVEEV